MFLLAWNFDYTSLKWSSQQEKFYASEEMEEKRKLSKEIRKLCIIRIKLMYSFSIWQSFLKDIKSGNPIGLYCFTSSKFSFWQTVQFLLNVKYYPQTIDRMFRVKIKILLFWLANEMWFPPDVEVSVQCILFVLSVIMQCSHCNLKVKRLSIMDPEKSINLKTDHHI